ncbi:MAG TPA: hypothetical protein VGF55_22910, partial [Gemmataceae bacterium]
TILPKADADAWLAAGFAEYERIVALEKALGDSGGKLTDAERDRLAVALNAYRSRYLAGARAGGDTPLARTRQTPGGDWYRVATGKGVLVLHELREALGTEKFCALMDDFGRANAGKEVTAAAFADHVAKATARNWDDFFAYWLRKPGLPDLKLESATVQSHAAAGAGNGGGGAGGFRVIGTLRLDGGPRRKVAVTVETAGGEQTQTIDVGETSSFTVETTDRPLRVVVDKYGRMAKANGGPYTPSSFEDERERALIVYGTRDEEAANRATAELLREKIRTHWSNVTVPVKADREVTEDDLRDRHLLLIGRPDTNRVVERFRDSLPVSFGWRSFAVRGETYAHAGGAVIAAAANPLNPRYSAVVLAGLSADATTRTPEAIYRKDGQGADVLILPNGGNVKALVTPARELVKEFNDH